MAATDKKISQLTALTDAPALTDYFEFVDISESLDADKNKRLTVDWLFRALSIVFYENEVVSYENDLVFP